jgi:hypothetical protein
VDIVTRLLAGLLCSIPGKNVRFLSSYCPDRLWGPPSFLSSEWRGTVSLGVKWSKLEVDHLPQCSPESMYGATHPLPHASTRLAV